jgi:cytochrome c
MFAASLATAEEATVPPEVDSAVARILSIDGDAAYGEYLGGECVTCHQQSGDASSIPAIRGLPAAYTVQALVEYRLGLRSNEVMKLVSARLKDEEIAALAAYFSDGAAR